jgi:phage gp29-like protein
MGLIDTITKPFRKQPVALAAVAKPQTLVDHDGRKVDRGQLKESQYEPGLVNLRQPWWASIADVLDPKMLATILHAVDMGEAWQYLVVVYELEDRWPRYYSVLSTRRLAVSGLTFTIKPGIEGDANAKRLADMCREMLPQKIVVDMVAESMDALSKGYSVNEIEWDTEGKTWWPKKFEYRDARHFRYDIMTGQELRVYDMENPGFGKPLVPFKAVVHQPKIKCGLPIKRGLGRLGLVPYMCHNYGVRDWMAFAETMGIPMRLGKYPTTASADERRALKTALRALGLESAGLIPETMSIEFEARGTMSGGDKIFEGLVRYFNEEMTIGVLGQSASTQGTPGKLGADFAQENVRNDIRTNDAMQMSATIDRDVIKPIVDLNAGPQAPAAYPVSTLTHERVETADDLQKESQAVSVYIDRAMPVKVDDIRAKFPWMTKPKEGDELLQPSNKTMPPAPGLPDPQTAPTSGLDDLPTMDDPDDAEKDAVKLRRTMRELVACFQEWDESQHPRDEDGKFGEGGSNKIGTEHGAEETEKTSEQWAASLPEPQQKAREAWIKSGSTCSLIRAIDKGETKFDGDPISPKEYALAKDFKEALKSAPVYEGKAFRGLRDVGAKEIQEMTTPGVTVTHNALSSWTSSRSVAETFAGKKGGSDNVLFEVHSRSMRQLTDAKEKLIDEKELISGKGHSIRVVSAKQVSVEVGGEHATYWHVQAEEI